MEKIAICADSTCDIGPELQEKYDVHLIPYTIISRDKTYTDNVDIAPGDLFEAFWEDGSLPQTSAINEAEYHEFFDEILKDHDAIVHITLGGAITSSAANCVKVAEDDPRIFAVDSHNLSTAMALLVIKAAEMRDSGKSASEIAAELENLRGKSHASFVLDTLEFMRAGGRCSSVTAIAASLLNIKPSIEVDNSDGSMDVGKKYRGKLKAVISKYVNDQIDRYDDIITDNIFITHTDIDDECIEVAREIVQQRLNPKNIYETTASCTISCHCGPGTLGILFLTES